MLPIKYEVVAKSESKISRNAVILNSPKGEVKKLIENRFFAEIILNEVERLRITTVS
ncbi:MAG: hypothetical protein K8R21_01415 [Leptospira sp.]|nr:hypothetical protein [Leptospira sp.]